MEGCFGGDGIAFAPVIMPRDIFASIDRPPPQNKKGGKMERKASFWAASAFALVAGMLFVSQDGQAQTASPDANNEAKQGSTFEDIVVVARRSEENLQSVLKIGRA